MSLNKILHPTKRHPFTGKPLEAVWVRPDGKVIWPILGGDDTVEPAPDPVDDPAGADPEGKGSKSAVLADLAKERKARQALEAQIGELAPLKDQMAALAAALGVKPEGKPGEDPIASIQAQLSQMQKENTLLRVANEHKITDPEDLDLLRSATDEQAMAKLAGRLAVKANEPGIPKPDATQGGKGDPVKTDPGPGLPRLQAAYADSETSTA